MTINQQTTHIKETTIKEAIKTLLLIDKNNKELIELGVKQVAQLWELTDGEDDEFIIFCKKNYYSDLEEKKKFFFKTSEYLEAINGNFNGMLFRLQRHIHENTEPLQYIDKLFSSYSPDSHLSEDLYKSKIAFIIILNFPRLTLDEKEKLGDNRLLLAYARMGDLFTNRIPAFVKQKCAISHNNAEVYISNYHIYIGQLLKNGKKIFHEGKILLSHWGLRDEIKANYTQKEESLEKQQTIYEVMKRIILQEIPVEVIHSNNYQWDPFSNIIYKNEKVKIGTPEKITRYEKFIDNFKALQVIDSYTGNTYIDRYFSETMEISVKDTEIFFHDYLSSPELYTIGKIISKRLNRKLEAFDIWYDGFKYRSNISESILDTKTRILYANAKAFEKKIHTILKKLGFDSERANYISKKITVDSARGSGHAWGAEMKGQQSHLRTPIGTKGMDYKGYNTAIHELGHNVEQTLSLYGVDYYLLSGVPNTAFTEALAFIFQRRDLELLGFDRKNSSEEESNLLILDKAWTLYEIIGVSMLDISVWKWIYINPNSTAKQLKNEIIRLSKEIWNKYFASVFGLQDQVILAIYSHMISYPLYLSAYAYGQIIEFQLEQYLDGKDFAKEIDRMYCIGHLTPTQWMLKATGSTISVLPLLESIKKTINDIKF
ncbi:MAG: hypothetical protein LBC54_01125 [Bacteroidales bacterium OttesenSCG-928-I14]|jgi:hypothetical protein|nr:hypothetical protein [Bacteroidales bacterium OttesenSCG-928-I14]